MPTSRHGFSTFLGCLLVLSACQSLTTAPDQLDYEYFPLEPGRYIIYNVQEDRYPIKGLPIQYTYQLKEVVGTSYTSVSGTEAYRLLRYRRATESQPWQPDSLWSARLVTNEAIRTENGHDFVSLLFPISNGQHWNGNRHNVLGEDDYEVRNAGQSFRVLDKQFNETVMVSIEDDSTLVSQTKRFAVYARQIGLIYKEQTSLQLCTDSPACIGKNQIEYGNRKIYRIQAYGKE